MMTRLAFWLETQIRQAQGRRDGLVNFLGTIINKHFLI